MKISRYSVQHPVVLMMLLIALALFGIVSVYDTNIEFMASVNTPQIFVAAIYPGASSEDIEETVVDVLEDDFVTLQNFKSVTSQSSNSVGVVTISFVDGVDPYSMLNEVRNRISMLEDQLPEGLAATPTAMVGGVEMLPIYGFTVSAGEDIDRISDYVESELKSKLTRIPGVTNVTVSGAVEPHVEVKLRLEDLAAKNASVLTAYQILAASNVKIPLGNASYGGSEIDMRFDGAYESLDEIRRLPIGATEEGDVIYLGDVADIEMVYEEPEFGVTSYGQDVLYVEVCKRADGNTVNIIKQIKAILEEETAKYAGALQFGVIQDDSMVIGASLKTVIQSGVMGILIAILVIFLFLNDIKATIVIGLSIPLSIFFTFIAMKLAGISVNLMSISGIVVALGSIVDASIVVLDQVYKFYQEKDDNGKFKHSVNQSIYRGTDLVDKSVVGSNFTTIVVFIPIALLGGIVGMILNPVSLTFMFAIGSSLVVAIVFVPFFLKFFLSEPGKRKTSRESIFVKAIHGIEKGYRKALAFSLDHSPFVLVIALSVLLVSGYTITKIGFAFIPSTDNDDFYINVEFPNGYSLEDTKEGMRQVEEILVEEVPEIRNYVCFSGKGSGMSFGASKNLGTVHVLLVPVAERDRDIHEIIQVMQHDLTARIPGASITVKNGGFDNLVAYVSGGGGYGITLVGDDVDVLYNEALRVEEFLKKDAQVLSTSVNSNFDTKVAVLDASYDYLSSLGLTTYEAGMTTAIIFNGLDVGKFTVPEMDRRLDISVCTDATDLPIDNQLLEKIKLKTQMGTEVSFASIADFRTEHINSQINHIDRANTITVSAQLTTESTSGVSKRVNRYLSENPLADGVTTRTGGMGELLEESAGPIIQAGLIAIFLVYMVMVLVFERFKHPILIMCTVPFCAVGVTLSLALFGSTLNMVSIMGVISLAGMLVNNGIIMVDYINQLNSEGRKMRLDMKGIQYEEDNDTFGLLPYDEEFQMLKDNIVKGTVSRLRPILMSALTTILGVIPMAIATGEGAEVYAPLGQVIMGGLTTSTFITLFMMPVFYFLSERRRMNVKYRKLRRNEDNE